MHTLIQKYNTIILFLLFHIWQRLTFEQLWKFLTFDCIRCCCYYFRFDVEILEMSRMHGYSDTTGVRSATITIATTSAIPSIDRMCVNWHIALKT